ncbi:hypothetical protein [Rhodococcus sp. UNC23MFCrub1.1]
MQCHGTPLRRFYAVAHRRWTEGNCVAASRSIECGGRHARVSRRGRPGHSWCGWTQMSIRYSTIEGVRQLLQFADHLEVVEPHEARTRVAELAADLAR